jgi:hypothetical protein
MRSTIGQVVDSTPMSSEEYRLASGFEANWPLPSLASRLAMADTTAQDTATQTDTCLLPRITINDGAVATNDTQVTLNICAAGAEQMMLSNDPDLGDAQWERMARTRAWTITPDSNLDVPPTVFAAFRYPDGSVQKTFSDAIIYDTSSPTGQVAVDHSAPRLLALTAQDEGSGVTQVQISAHTDFSNATWEVYTTTIQLPPGDATTTRHVRFRDQAGNISEPVSIEIDTQSPTGSIELDPAELAPRVGFTTLALTAQDNLSDHIDMRMSEDVAFTASAWQPFTPTVTMPISSTNEGWGVIYVQYRDQAGNESVIYGALYGVDASLPEVTAAWLMPSDTQPRTLTVHAEDMFTGVEWLHLSNDPMMLEDVVTVPYTETVSWTLDEREVVWVQVEDGVGNRSLLYPATIHLNEDQRIYLPFVKQ